MALGYVIGVNTTRIQRNGRAFELTTEGDLWVARDVETGVTGTGYSVGAAIRNTRGLGR